MRNLVHARANMYTVSIAPNLPARIALCTRDVVILDGFSMRYFTIDMGVGRVFDTVPALIRAPNLAARTEMPAFVFQTSNSYCMLKCLSEDRCVGVVMRHDVGLPLEEQCFGLSSLGRDAGTPLLHGITESLARSKFHDVKSSEAHAWWEWQR